MLNRINHPKVTGTLTNKCSGLLLPGRGETWYFFKSLLRAVVLKDRRAALSRQPTPSAIAAAEP